MKIIYSFFVLAFSSVILSCNSGNKQGVPDNAINPDVMKNPATASSSPGDKSKVPVIQLDEESHDFGTITQGEKVSYSFKFKNIGAGDLVIRHAQGSCGCTVPEWPKDPIPAGGSGIIKVTFDSEGKMGMQHKTVTLISNTIPNTKVIYITVEVVNPEDKK